MLLGVFLESNTHQIFHFRTVWLGLAVMEATLFRITMSPSVDITWFDDKMSLLIDFRMPMSPSVDITASVDFSGQKLELPKKSLPLTDYHDPSSVEAE